MNSTLGKTSVGIALLAVCISSIPAFAEKLIIPPLENQKIYCAPVQVETQCESPKVIESKVEVEKPCASLKSTEKVTETVSQKTWNAPKKHRKRSSFKRKHIVHRHAMKRRMAPRVRVVTKYVRIERTKLVEKTVERPVYIDRIVEKPVYIEKCVEKPVYIDRIVEKQVAIEQPIVLKKRSHFIRLGTPIFSIGLF